MSCGTENEKMGTCSTLGGAHLEPGAGHHGIGSDRVFSLGGGGSRALDRMGGVEFGCSFSDRVGPGLALAAPGGLDFAGGAGCVSDRVFDHC